MVNALDIAKKFHEAYERLAPSFGYETRTETRAFDPETPNGRLMIAVCQEVGDQIENSAFHAGRESGMREGKYHEDWIVRRASKK